MSRTRLFAASIALALAACAGRGPSFSGPNPAPRDVTSPEELSPDLARTRIFWWKGEGEQRKGYFMYLDGSDPLSIPLPRYAVTTSASPSGRYFVYTTSLLPNADIEMLDVQTGERRVLVRGRERFPGAVLRFPSFTPDEGAVVFEVASGDRIDLAMVRVDSGEVEFIDLQGGMNMRPKVSPDGRRILVQCEDPDLPGFTLCLLDREKRVRTYLTDDPVGLDSGEFTPDGRFVVYVAVSAMVGSEGRLYRIGVDGKDKQLLVSALRDTDDVRATTTDEAVFTCRFAEKPACIWLCVVRLDGTDVRRLAYLGAYCPAENGR